MALDGIQGPWMVTSLAIGGELQPPIEGSTLTLQVDGTTVSGTTGVNRFSGLLSEDGVFGSLATTRMAGPHELMAQEQIFLQHLADADRVEEDEEGISVLADELVVLTLRPPDLEPKRGQGTGTSRETS